MANFVAGVIALVIGTIMVINVLMPVIKGANTDSFSASELAVYGITSLGAIVGLAYGAFAIFGLA